jgi:hypothetical protein
LESQLARAKESIELTLCLKGEREELRVVNVSELDFLGLNLVGRDLYPHAEKAITVRQTIVL